MNRLACFLACTLSASLAHAAPDAAKQALIDRVLQLWHPENVAVMMVQRPAADAVQQSRIALQGRVSAEKRDAVLKDIVGEAQRYVDAATPLAQQAAGHQLPLTVARQLDAQFSAEELRQLVQLLESPVKRKFEQFLPQAEKALGEAVTAEAGAAIQPRLQAMTEAVGLKLRAASMAP